MCYPCLMCDLRTFYACICDNIHGWLPNLSHNRKEICFNENKWENDWINQINSGVNIYGLFFKNIEIYSNITQLCVCSSLESFVESCVNNTITTELSVMYKCVVCWVQICRVLCTTMYCVVCYVQLCCVF